MVAHDPLHRSGRAALPHPAPALGDDGQAVEGIWVADICGRKPPDDEAFHPVPTKPSAGILAAPFQDAVPEPTDGIAEDANGPAVHGHAVVADVPPHDRAQVRALLRDAVVQASPKLDLDLFELRPQPRAHRLPQHRELPRPGLRATVRSGRTMARTGLRMMPTFPSSPLRFRTAGFPQYGSKVGLSDVAFPCTTRAKPAPGLPSRCAVCTRPSCSPRRTCGLRSAPQHAARWSTAARADSSPYPRGPRSEPGYAVPVHPRLIGPIRPTRGHSAISPPCGLYALPSLCGSA